MQYTQIAFIFTIIIYALNFLGIFYAQREIEMKKDKESPRHKLNGKFKQKGYLLAEDKDRQLKYYALHIETQQRKGYFNDLAEAATWIENA